MSTTLSTGRLARESGVNVETLRYYERRGLLKQPPRSPGGRRAYDAGAVTLVRSIKRAQALGFSLDEIAELLRLERRHGNREALASAATRKIADIDDRIAALTEIRVNLATLLEQQCDSLTGCTCGRGCVLETPVAPVVADRDTTLDLLACNVDLRPPAPGPDELAPFVTEVRRQPGTLEFAYRPEARPLFETFVQAERQCCAGLGWELLDGPEPALRITGTPEQLDALHRLFVEPH